MSGTDAARMAAKAAFKAAMDAATKAANLAFACSQSDPTNEAKWLAARDAWQNSATECANNWRAL